MFLSLPYLSPLIKSKEQGELLTRFPADMGEGSCFGRFLTFLSAASGIGKPFYHLPPVLQEPIKFPSYSSGPVRAQALQQEVDKMLEKKP